MKNQGVGVKPVSGPTIGGLCKFPVKKGASPSLRRRKSYEEKSEKVIVEEDINYQKSIEISNSLENLEKPAPKKSSSKSK